MMFQAGTRTAAAGLRADAHDHRTRMISVNDRSALAVQLEIQVH
jgi:hypothetical protein